MKLHPFQYPITVVTACNYSYTCRLSALTVASYFIVMRYVRIFLRVLVGNVCVCNILVLYTHIHVQSHNLIVQQLSAQEPRLPEGAGTDQGVSTVPVQLPPPDSDEQLRLR